MKKLGLWVSWALLLVILVACDGHSMDKLGSTRQASSVVVGITGPNQGPTFGVAPAAAQTVGQTLVVPTTETVLRSIAFGPMDVDAGIVVRAFVFAWSDALTHATGNALFTSAPSTSTGGSQTFSFPTNDLTLTANSKVIAFLTVSADTNTTGSTGHTFFATAGGGGDYAQGEMFTLANGTDTTQWTTVVWDNHPLMVGGDDLAGTFTFVSPSTVTLGAAPASSTFGQSVTFTATVGGDAPTGTVTFKDNGTIIGSSAIVAGAATLSTSALSIATHPITAEYSGDTVNGSSATAAPLNYVVGAATTTTSLADTPAGTSVAGQSVTFTATVSSGAGTPTGSVVFKDGGVTLGTVALTGGAAALNISSLAVGNHSITAEYAASGNFGASSAGPLTHAVSHAATSTSVTTSKTPAIIGESITFTATVSVTAPGAGTPTGTVTFKDGAVVIGSNTLTAGGTATLTTNALALGGHSITAEYAGDTSFLGSTSLALTEVIAQDVPSVALSATPSPSTYGSNVTLNVTVTPATGTSGAATGTVTFRDGGALLGTGTLVNGSTSLATSALVGGAHSLSATYEGDANHQTATSTIPHTVNPAGSTVTLQSSANPSVFGEAVTLTATVTGPGALKPTGVVTFIDATTATTLGATNLNAAASASLVVTSLSPATHAIVATYAGDSNFSTGGSSAVSEVVNRASTSTTVSSSTNPSLVGLSVTFRASVVTLAPGTGTPSGTVTFRDGGNTIGTGNLDGSGVATFTTSALGAGAHSITAQYGGSPERASSVSATLPQVVNQDGTSVTVTSSSNPSPLGATVTFTATLASTTVTPTGTVTFLEGAVTLGTGVLANGVATFATAALTGGNHTITARYEGDATHTGGSTGSIVQVITTAATTTALTSSANPSVFGQSVTFTATVTSPVAGPRTGTVLFKDGATTLGTVTLGAAGTATLTSSTLTATSHSITAVYSGDTNFATSTSAALVQVVNKSATTTTLISSSNPSLLGAKVTFTVTVAPVAPGAGAPTGTIVWKRDGALLGNATVDAAGIATFETSTLPEGTSSITAEYSGDGSFEPSASSALSQRVSSKAATIALASSPSPSTYGSSVTFSATLTGGAGTPTGSVLFREGPSTIGTVDLADGKATISKSNLSAGTHTITVEYSGDATYASGGGALAHVVDKATSTILLSSSANPSTFGSPLLITATVASTSSGFTGQVELFDATTSLGKVGVTGTTAVFSLPTLAEGAHVLTAVYSGDINFTGSTSAPFEQKVVGTGDAGTSVPRPSVNIDDNEPNPVKEESCSCRVVGTSSSGGASVGAGILFAALAIRRRRRAHSSSNIPPHDSHAS